MTLTIRERPGTTGSDGTRVQVETRFPYTAMGRKLYCTAAGSSFRVPEAHVHTSSHLLMCIIGEAVVAYRPAPDAAIVRRRIHGGETWRVDGGTPHQLLVEPDSIVASYFSPLSWLGHNETLEKLGEDWYADETDSIRAQ